MSLLVISTARTSSVSASIPRWTLRQTRRLGPPCLRAFHSPSTLMPPRRFARTGGAYRLDVDQEVQRTLRGPMRDVHRQCLLATTERAEVRHLPVQINAAQQAFDKPASPWSLGPVAFPWLDLPERRAEPHLHRHAGLDGRIARAGLPTTLPARFNCPGHIGVQPDRQPATALERLVVHGPVQSRVARWVRSAHAPQLSRWIHEMNPLQPICATEPPHGPKHPGNRQLCEKRGCPNAGARLCCNLANRKVATFYAALWLTFTLPLTPYRISAPTPASRP